MTPRQQKDQIANLTTKEKPAPAANPTEKKRPIIDPAVDACSRSTRLKTKV